MESNPLYHFQEFNNQIFNVYEKYNLLSLAQKEFRKKNSGAFMIDIVRKKTNIHSFPHSDFKIYDELDFVTKDIRYVTGILYFYVPLL